MPGTLYIVATPIGNLEDITLRAIAVLSSVDLIACEDTRVTMKLLGRYDIHKPLLSLHARSERGKAGAVVKLLREGKSVAFVSDAGTPAVSDPGSALVSAVRTALPDAKVVAVPGASAAVAALSIAGVPASEFLFLGFLPHKKGRETLFREIAGSKRTAVFYESPHRIMKALQSLAEFLPPGRRVTVGRELTKHSEETVSGTAEEVKAAFAANAARRRGEFVIIVSP